MAHHRANIPKRFHTCRHPPARRDLKRPHRSCSRSRNRPPEEPCVRSPPACSGCACRCRLRSTTSTSGCCATARVGQRWTAASAARRHPRPLGPDLPRCGRKCRAHAGAGYALSSGPFRQRRLVDTAIRRAAVDERVRVPQCPCAVPDPGGLRSRCHRATCSPNTVSTPRAWPRSEAGAIPTARSSLNRPPGSCASWMATRSTSAATLGASSSAGDTPPNMRRCTASPWVC